MKRKIILIIVLAAIFLSACTPKDYRNKSYCESDDDCKIFTSTCDGRKFSQNLYYKHGADVHCQEYRSEFKIAVYEPTCKENKCIARFYADETCDTLKKSVNEFNEVEANKIINSTTHILQATHPEFECD